MANNGKNLSFSSIKVTASEGPEFDLDGISHVRIQKADASKGTGVFLRVSGANSRDIQIENSDLSGARDRVILAGGASGDAVVIK